eukprot:39026-Eustigmatos_ZCMA.PRE.1
MIRSAVESFASRWSAFQSVSPFVRRAEALRHLLIMREWCCVNAHIYVVERSEAFHQKHAAGFGCKQCGSAAAQVRTAS